MTNGTRARLRGTMMDRIQRSEIDLDTTCSFRSCEAEQSDHLNVPLCDRHAIAVYRDMRDLLDNSQDAAMPNVIEQMVSARESRPVWFDEGKPARRPPNHVVYFVAFADRIKIGTTGNLSKRLASLPVDAILATIPGGRDVEVSMHSRFADARIGRTEWFTRSPELLAFIEGIRAA